MKKLFFFFFLSAGLFIANAQTPWYLTGNSGTNPSSNFIGTTDAEPLIFKTEGTERMRLLNDKTFLGIGTTLPKAPFHLHVAEQQGKTTPLMQLTTFGSSNTNSKGFQVYTYDGTDIHFEQKEEAPFYIKGNASEIQFAPDGDITVSSSINERMRFDVNGILQANVAEVGGLIATSAGVNGNLFAYELNILKNANIGWTLTADHLNGRVANITNTLTVNALKAQSANIGNFGNITGDNLNVQSAKISGKVNIGTSGSSINLDVKGIIRSEEVRVCMNQGCDYVFEDDYELMNLSDLHSFIKINKHLPDVAPAAEMEAEGINVSEMNALLLRKVEELTLYILQQNEKMTVMQEQINELKKQ